MGIKPAVSAKIIRLNTEKKPAKPKDCPICKKPAIEGYFPFCSKRCGDIDLGNWLNGSYAIPSDENMAATDDFDDDSND